MKALFNDQGKVCECACHKPGAAMMHFGPCCSASNDPCSSTTAEQRRDLVIQSALDSTRTACLILQNDKSIEREPGVDQYCLAVLNGCPK